MPRLELHPDRLFSSQQDQRNVARRLFETVCDLPIISPHGHTDPRWFAENEAFVDPATLLITPDHYLFRMLYSVGVPLESLGIQRLDGDAVETDPRKIWQCFADHYYLFNGTPSRLWLDHAMASCFGVTQQLTADTAMEIYDQINGQLRLPAFRPRALFDQFNIALLATTESPLDTLGYHDEIQRAGWDGKVITTYRPDPVVDPDYEGFANNVARFGELSGEDTSHWQGYLAAHRISRQAFIKRGATATDHGHPGPQTADLSATECEKLFQLALAGELSAEQAELFRAQMLTEMAAMSLDDGLVMQIHPGVKRNHNASVFANFGRDKGADLPASADYVQGLKPLLDKFGNNPQLAIILFTLDETSYSRDLAPLAGHYPCLKLGPPWWFFDSVEGMLRYKRAVIETAGFYNTAGFNDDTRAFLSIPARHDVARRIDCRHLAELVCEHRLTEDDAAEIAIALSSTLVQQAYRLDLN